MSDPADFDRLVARIRGELRAERERDDPERARLEEKLRQIRGRPDRGSMPRFLLAILISVMFLIIFALVWRHG